MILDSFSFFLNQLTYLCLSSNRITDHGAILLANAIDQMHLRPNRITLRSLILFVTFFVSFSFSADNHIGNRGAMALFKVLPQAASLTELDLSGNQEVSNSLLNRISLVVKVNARLATNLMRVADNEMREFFGILDLQSNDIALKRTCATDLFNSSSSAFAAKLNELELSKSFQLKKTENDFNIKLHRYKLNKSEIKIKKNKSNMPIEKKIEQAEQIKTPLDAAMIVCQLKIM